MSVIIMHQGILATDSRGLAPNGFYDGVQKLFVNGDNTIAFATAGQTLSPEEAPVIFELIDSVLTRFTKGQPHILDVKDMRTLFSSGDESRTYFIITAKTCYRMEQCKTSKMIMQNSDHLRKATPKLFTVELNSPETAGTGDDIAFLCLSRGYSPQQAVSVVCELKFSCGGTLQHYSQSELVDYNAVIAEEELGDDQ